MSRVYVLNGHERARPFKLKEGANFIGRSPLNDISIKDETVSNKHLKIHKKGERYFIEDLKSKNGTFVNGSEINPGIAFEVEEGIAILVGATLLCLGEECLEHVLPFLHSTNFLKDLTENAPGSIPGGLVSYQKQISLVRNVSKVLAQPLPMNEILGKVLDYIFDFSKRIDRAAIILVDPKTGEIRESISKTGNSSRDTTQLYNWDVVEGVLKKGKPITMFDTFGEHEDGFSETLKVSRVRSVMCIPLISKSRIIGVTYVDSLKKPLGFQKEDLSLFTYLSKKMAVAIEKSLQHGQSGKMK